MKSKLLHICAIMLVGTACVNVWGKPRRGQPTPTQDPKIASLSARVDSLQESATALVDANLASEISSIQASQATATRAMENFDVGSDVISANAMIIHESKKEAQILLTQLQAGENAAQQAIVAQISALKTAQESAAADAAKLQADYEAANAKLAAMQAEGGAVKTLEDAAEQATSDLEALSDRINGHEADPTAEPPVEAADGLAAQIAAMDASSASSSALATVQGTVRNITSTLTTLQTQLTKKAESAVLAAISSQVSNRADTKDLKALQTKVDNAVTAKADKSTLSSLESRLENQIDRIETRISNSSTSSAKTSSSSGATAVDTLQQDLSKLNVNAAQQASNIASLQKKVSNMESGKALLTSLALFKNQIDSAMAGKANVSDLTQLNSQARILGNDVDYTRSEITRLVAKMDSFDSKMKEFDGSTVSSDDFATFSSDFETTKAQVTDLQSLVSRNDSAITAANAIYDALNASMSDAVIKLTALNETISDHLTLAASDLAAKNAEIERLKGEILRLDPNADFTEIDNMTIGGGSEFIDYFEGLHECEALSKNKLDVVFNAIANMNPITRESMEEVEMQGVNLYEALVQGEVSSCISDPSRLSSWIEYMSNYKINQGHELFYSDGHFYFSDPIAADENSVYILSLALKIADGTLRNEDHSEAQQLIRLFTREYANAWRAYLDSNS